MGTIIFFLSSGLFLGWSLGANDAANVFGTAVGTKMIKFRTAALVCSLFVLIGAVVGGAGAAHTLGKLGAVNKLAGSFTVAFSAALTVTWMTKLKLPVSTSQAVVGAIIGWNFYAGLITEGKVLSKIVSTWIMCPLLSIAFSLIFYYLLKLVLKFLKIHMLKMDIFTRIGLIIVGAYGSYALGANNIANVMGVFVSVSPFQDVTIANMLHLSGAQLLFGIGALAIGLGIYTYSKKVMDTVGGDLFELSPLTALVVVLASSTVLFVFASVSLKAFLQSHNLPSFPLVPVSSSQAVVGAVIGISIAKTGGRNVNYKVLGNISMGWMTTPLISGLLSFVCLFVVNNVFMQPVNKTVTYGITEAVIEKAHVEGEEKIALSELSGKIYKNQLSFASVIKSNDKLGDKTKSNLLKYSENEKLYIDPLHVNEKSFGEDWLTEGQVEAMRALAGKTFVYKWKLIDELSALSADWAYKDGSIVNVAFNKHLKNNYAVIYKEFSILE